MVQFASYAPINGPNGINVSRANKKLKLYNGYVNWKIHQCRVGVFAH